MREELLHGTRVTLEREAGYSFRVRFDGAPRSEFVTDEPPPVGEGAGPDPAALLGAAVANCLASSLLFCLGKARIEVKRFRAEAEVVKVRNAQGRLRIGAIHVKLEPTVAPADRDSMGRCLGLFESFCMVTESVRQGIDVRVTVRPGVETPAPCAAEPATRAPDPGDLVFAVR